MSTVHTWHTISSRCRGAVYIEQAFVWGYPLHRINIQWQLLKTITSECIQLFYTPSPPPLTKLGGRYIEITVSVCPSLSVFPDFCGWHLLNRSSVCNQTWLIRTHQKEMVLNCRMAVEKMFSLTRWNFFLFFFFANFKVKVTARASVIKIWLFLLDFQYFWSVCNQTWFDGTPS